MTCIFANTLNKLYSVMFAWSDFFELSRVPACCKDDLNLLHTWTPNLYGFLPCKSLEVTYGSVKIIFKTKINSFAFSETTKSEQQLLRQNYFHPRHRQLLSWQVPKSERYPSGFRAFPKTHLEPHFAHFRAFLNIFEQIEWQIRFPRPILSLFPKSDFYHWSTPLRTTSLGQNLQVLIKERVFGVF